MIIGDILIKLQSEQHFEELKRQFTVFMFSADWCPDCRFIEPFLDDLEKKYSLMQFVYVDRDEFIDLCREHNIYGIPSFLVYKDNELKGSFISKFRKTKEEIMKFLDSVM